MTSSPVQGRSICPVAGRGRPCLLLISARVGQGQPHVRGDPFVVCQPVGFGRAVGLSNGLPLQRRIRKYMLRSAPGVGASGWRPSGLVDSAQRRERERTNLFTPASRRPSSSIPAGPAIPLATRWEFVSLARLSEPSPCSSKVSLEVAALGLAAEDGDLLSMGPSGRNGVRNVLFSGRLLLARPLVGESADPWRPLDERTPQVKSRLHLRLKRAVDHIAENRVDLRPSKTKTTSAEDR
jgi:hypothetical protein